MFEAHHTAVLEFFRARTLLSEPQLDAIETDHEATGRSAVAVVLDNGWVDRIRLWAELAEHLGLDHLPACPASIPDTVAEIVSADIARTYGVAPWQSESNGVVNLLAVDPFNSRIVEDLTFALGRDINVMVGDPDDIEALIKRQYGEDEATLDELLVDIENVGADVDEDGYSATELEALAGQAPIVRFVNLVLSQAIKDKASDIHFEPFETDYKIRYRVDGALYEMAPPPKHLALPIASRLKVLANLNIAERRVPQDGRIKITLSGRPVDLRVSTLPTQFGESVVLRVLDQGAVQLDLKELSIPDAIEHGITETIHRPNGILIVTGPTGSGKTTTLYSALRELNQTERKLLTAEDPVEYEIEGVMQVPINPAIGLTFGSVLRTFLRHDPDVIMVGEIRDLETAQIAIQASLTGHLVLATLHTNDAAGAVTRLIDMGVEPYLISSSVEAVLAQRLVRRICRNCVETYEPTPEILDQLGGERTQFSGRHFSRGKGCVKCSQTGYHGRHGLFEWLPMNDALREQITKSGGTVDLREKAVSGGMKTLRQAGIDAVLAGSTTVEEILQYT
jgi:type IV pilus assembly protein PilB